MNVNDSTLRTADAPPSLTPGMNIWDGTLGMVSNTLAEHTNIPVTGIAAHVMAYASSALSTSVTADYEDHPASVWTMCVGDGARAAANMVTKVLGAAFPDLSRASTGAFGAPDLPSRAEKIHASEYRGVHVFTGGDPIAGLTSGSKSQQQLRFMEELWTQRTSVRVTDWSRETYDPPKSVVAGTSSYGAFHGRRAVNGRRSGAYAMFTWALCDMKGPPTRQPVPDDVARRLMVQVAKALGDARQCTSVEVCCPDDSWESIMMAARTPRHVEMYPGELTQYATSHILRIAQVCAALDGSVERDVLIVNESHLKQALAWWQYSQDSYSWVMNLGPTKERKQVAAATELADWLDMRLLDNPEGVSRTQISTEFFGKNALSKDMKPILALLPDLGFEVVQRKGRGRPAYCYRRPTM